MTKLRARLPGPRWAVIAVPYLWMLLFFAVPFAIMLKISFASSAIAMPPYTDIVQIENSHIKIDLNIENYQRLCPPPSDRIPAQLRWTCPSKADDLYMSAYWSSLKIAFLSTLLCLLIGYPIAYGIARMSPAMRNIALMLVILPSWTSFLLRIYAWIGILKPNGLLNTFLTWLGVIDQPMQILYTSVAVYIGIVYVYLPFMVLPLYTNLIKHDGRLLEAASDLGAPPWKAFLQVTLPLSKAGIIAGSMLVMIPVVGEFVIPELLGGPDTLMIGRVLWQEYFSSRDWPVASAVGVVMLVLLIVPIMIFHHYQSKELESTLS